MWAWQAEKISRRRNLGSREKRRENVWKTPRDTWDQTDTKEAGKVGHPE